MGQKSATETIAAIFAAFLARRRWPQATLARELGISAASLRKRLVELQSSGLPLDSTSEHPHVVWTIDPGWYPGAVVIEDREIKDLLRILLEAPRTRARDRLLGKVRVAQPLAYPPAADDAFVAPRVTEQEQATRAIVEDAALRRVALHFSYESSSAPPSMWRHASVHRVLTGEPQRFLAVCHRKGDLRVFRTSRVLAARLDADSAFRDASREEIERAVDEMVRGFVGRGPKVRCEFLLLAPESRWTVQELPASNSSLELVPEGVRVRVATSAVLPLARWIVGLGALARCESAELAEAVRGLAEGAMRGARERPD